MARNVKILKIGKATMLDLNDPENVDSNLKVIFNKTTDFYVQSDVLVIQRTPTNIVKVKFDEIQDKLGATDISDYAEKAATAGMFNPHFGA